MPDKSANIAEGFVSVGGESMYRIPDVHHMPPFLMSIVSDTDLWMYVSSYGGLTAGRVDENHSLFPYETDDKLYRAHGVTGPFTLLRVQTCCDGLTLWEPFTDRYPTDAIQRNLYKSVTGNSVVFEEKHADLGLTFRYRWANCDAYGFVRTTEIINESGVSVTVGVLDGLLNLLPAGPPLGLQQGASCLIDAYSRADVLPESGLAVLFEVALASDKAEPMESLTANTVWAHGLPDATVLLSQRQVEAFRVGEKPTAEAQLTGQRAAYLVTAEVTVPAGGTQRWYIVADVDRDQAAVEALDAKLRSGEDGLHDAIAAGTANLTRFVAAADGLQSGADEVMSAHHFANVMFNIMRGGIFLHDYLAPADDVRDFIKGRNKHVAAKHEAALADLSGDVNCLDLCEWAKKTGDPGLRRLCYEYLPLTFSRRHGDPSRPWNRFAIKVKNRDGSRVLNYQGNWRDIFQNWEATAQSFPEFIDNIIAKFVNASTVDGHNPYRVTRDGLDWEVVDPADPWSHIGYWGDHQIIYLLKFLEASQRYAPDCLLSLLPEACYTYADVPYRLHPYANMVKTPKHTIDFDQAREKAVLARVAAIGADGRLLPDGRGGILHVTLAEKLLVPALAKLGNLVPDGGIWLNTQRPEWNDANNALVGNGISMVTLCYLRRYLAFCRDLFARAEDSAVALSTEVAQWYDDTLAVLTRFSDVLGEMGTGTVLPVLISPISDKDRRAVLNALGEAFSDYRAKVYANGFTGTVTRDASSLVALCDAALPYLDHAIRANKRPDGLYHAYNLLTIDPEGDTACVSHLYEMLEGQVAVLSSGLLGPDDTTALLDALFTSALLRPDLGAFLLYPNRRLPGFLEKNIVPTADAEAIGLLAAMLEAGDTSIVLRDVAGHVRFASEFHNRNFLIAALDAWEGDTPWSRLVSRDRDAVLALYEQVFNHRAFTGRSGTMYGYEGLGCIYWHMEAKLLLAAQEAFMAADDTSHLSPLTSHLAKQYYRVREGLGFNKSAEVYGAFPTDPYSHTPLHAGAQQPGMTGQVKEEILTRFGELGVTVRDGRLAFRPRLLRRREFLTEAKTWDLSPLTSDLSPLTLNAGSLGFTVCGVPVIYMLSDSPAPVKVTRANGTMEETGGNVIGRASSREVFRRTGAIRSIAVTIPRDSLLLD